MESFFFFVFFFVCLLDKGCDKLFRDGAFLLAGVCERRGRAPKVDTVRYVFEGGF